MKSKIIIDTSPLVDFIDKSDNFHLWTVETWKNLCPLDSDFRIYRQYKNQVIPVIMPE
ncbi:MAG: hypothetical protein ACK5OU_09150 [Dolichospermum sp.]